MDIVPVTRDNANIWARLCNELWPNHPDGEMLEAFCGGEYENEYLARVDGEYAAFISLSVRRDYVEGKTGSGPVGYVEGIYVRPGFRRRGIAGELVEFAKKWSRERGCGMLASDCDIKNEESRMFHNRIGFAEAGVNVHFKMDL